MRIPAIRVAASGDEASAIGTVVLAFGGDPVVRWCWPDSHQYLTSMPGFTRAFGGGAFANDSAFCTEDFGGAALWLPPNVHPDEATLGDIVDQTVSEPTRGELLTMLDQMAANHPDEPHWYLPLIGVDPARQGSGYGGALMTHALQRCDREGRLAYLESTNPRNMTLYERHGFKALGRIQVGSSPPMIPMLRHPR